MSNIPIFCINLDRADERKQTVQQEWINKLKLDIKFWKAYDRRDIKEGNYVYPYDSKATKTHFNRELSYGEIACATSFAMLYEFSINNDFEEIIVMEDYISPLINHKNILFNYIQEAKKEFPDCEFIILQGKPVNQKYNEIETKVFFSKIYPIPYGNFFLYLNKSGIYKIYNLLRQMIFPADVPQNILFKQGLLNVIVSNIALAEHNTLTTYIGNDLRFDGKASTNSTGGKNNRKFIA